MKIKLLAFLFFVAFVLMSSSTSATVSYTVVNNDIKLTGSGSTNLGTISTEIADSSLISESSGVIFLNSNLTVETGITLFINASDCNLLKINSTNNNIHFINNSGILYIDNTEIAGWNTTTAGYEDLSSWDVYVSSTSPRSYVVAANGLQSHAYITNSEIHHLGMGYSWIDYPTPYYSLSNEEENIVLYDHPIIDCGLTIWNSDNNLIQNNTIHDNKYGIVVINESDNNQLIDNTIYDSLSDGIMIKHYCDNVTINSNNVTNANIERNPIEFQYHILNSNISDNLVNLGHQGIYLQGSNDNNFIINNTVIGSEVGIRLYSGTSGNLVQYNNVYNCTWTGLEIRVADDNIIDNNLFTGTQYVGYNNGDGIYSVYGANNNTYTNNTLSNNAGYGIAIYTRFDTYVLSVDNLIQNNFIYDNADGGVYLGSVEDSSIINNIFKNSIPYWTDYNGTNNVFADNIKLDLNGFYYREAGGLIQAAYSGGTLSTDNIEYGDEFINSFNISVSGGTTGETATLVSDSFENDPAYDYDEGSTTYTMVVDNTTVRTGNYSIHMNATLNQKSYRTLDLGENFNGIYEVWMYDDATMTDEAVSYISDGSNYIYLGHYNSANYTYRINTNSWVDTGIVRTTGWHLITFDSTSGSIIGYIDDDLALDNSTLSYFSIIGFGNWWNLGTDDMFYFDDVRVYSEADSIDVNIQYFDTENTSSYVIFDVSNITDEVSSWNVSWNNTESGSTYYLNYENGTEILNQTATSDNQTVWFNSSVLLPEEIYYISEIEMLSIEYFTPADATPLSTEGTKQTFSINLNKVAISTAIYIDSELVAWDNSTATPSYSNSTASAGEYNITMIATDDETEVSKTWIWTVGEYVAPSEESGTWGSGGADASFWNSNMGMLSIVMTLVLVGIGFKSFNGGSVDIKTLIAISVALVVVAIVAAAAPGILSKI